MVDDLKQNYFLAVYISNIAVTLYMRHCNLLNTVP